MPIEILAGKQDPAAPVLWRSITPESGSPVKEPNLDPAARLEEARRDGYANGLAAARQEADQAIIPAVQKLADAIAQTARIRDTVRERATDDLVRLALAIASRVLHREVALDTIVLAGLLKAGFEKMRSQEISVARIHPGLEPMLRRCMERGGIPGNLYLLTDPKLPFGKMLFETDAVADPAAADSYAGIDLSEIDSGFTDKLPK